MKHYKSMKLGGPLKKSAYALRLLWALWKQAIYSLQLLLGVPLKAKWPAYTVHYSCYWAPLKARYFTHYSCKGGPRQVPHFPSLKHTTAYNPDNDLIWEYETNGTRCVHPICVVSDLTCDINTVKTLPMERNPFSANNQTLRSYRVGLYNSPTK